MYRLILLILSLSLVGCLNVSTVQNTKPEEINLNELADINTFTSSFEQSGEYNVVKSDMYLKYDPYDAKVFLYNVVLISKSLREVVVTAAIYADGKIVKEFTISIDPFKKGYYSGELKFDKPAAHKFEVKIEKITYF